MDRRTLRLPLAPWFSGLVVALCLFFAPFGRAAERLDRGMVALRTGETSVYLGWRFLADDPAGRVFNIYRSTAGGAPQEGPELGRIELPAATPVRPYLSLKLQDENTTFQKVALADLDGDGKLDFVIKQPSVGLDPGTPAFSPDTYKLEAYRHDGTFLWRKDLGWNLNLGIWWTPFVVWDFDGDGKAEVAVKTAPFAAARTRAWWSMPTT
jgi:rhamnogalacturonan endolyase